MPRVNPPLTICSHFGIKLRKLGIFGAFNSRLDCDSQLFVDPFLLKSAETEEFVGARDEVFDYFRQVIKLLERAPSRSGVIWTKAVSSMRVPDLPIGLGYSKGLSGNALGPKLSLKLIEAIDEVVKAGVNDPEIFEIVGVLQEGIGCDRIGDLCSWILRKRVVAYSTRVFERLGFLTERAWTYDGTTVHLPLHPRKVGVPILLIPTEFLSDLPIAYSAADIDHVSGVNQAVRDKLNAELGRDWRDRRRRDIKTEYRKVLTRNPNLLREVVGIYKNASAASYDFSEDAKGIYLFDRARDLAAAMVGRFAEESGPFEVAKKIIEMFKNQIETKGAWKLLYNENGKAKREAGAQQLFRVTASLVSKAAGLI